MLRLLIGLILVSGCGSIRTVSFEEENDDGCENGDCGTGTTAIPTGSSSTGSGGSDTEDDGDWGEEDGGTTTQFVPDHRHGRRADVRHLGSGRLSRG